MKQLKPAHSGFIVGGVGASEATQRVSKTLSNDIGHSALVTEIEVHLGRHISYAALYVPDALAASSLAVKDSDVVGIGLRIVGIHKAEQHRLSGTVWPGKSPAFAAAHGPRHILKNHASAIFHIAAAKLECHLVMLCHASRLGDALKVDGIIHKRHDAVAHNLHIALARYRLAYAHVDHRYHRVDHCRYLAGIAQQQHHRDASRRHVGYSLVEQVARRSIKTYVGIVHYKQVGRLKQHVDHKELAQLAARQEVDLLVLDSLKAHPAAIDVPLRHVDALSHKLPHRGDFIVHRSLVTLLVVLDMKTAERVYVAKLDELHLQVGTTRTHNVGGNVPSLLKYSPERRLARAVGAYHRSHTRLHGDRAGIVNRQPHITQLIAFKLYQVIHFNAFYTRRQSPPLQFKIIIAQI